MEWRTTAGLRGGWTLQEYLAPKVIKFHGQDWDPLTSYISGSATEGDINDKSSKSAPLIQRKIEEATGIPPSMSSHFQHSSPLSRGGIIKQMQWAARRETTRPEDRSYSLMGIFNVSFSIATAKAVSSRSFRLVQGHPQSETRPTSV